mgnify:CR=1 FL=1
MTRPPVTRTCGSGSRRRTALAITDLPEPDFTDDAAGSPAQNLERDAVDGVRPIGPGGQRHAEVLDG